MADTDYHQDHGKVVTNSWVAWIALALAIIALVFAWVAYDKVVDVESQVRGGASEVIEGAQEGLEGIQEDVQTENR